MIEIIEIGKVLDEDAEPLDMLYYVTIGHSFIAEFIHNRSDGLAICFDKAAKAVRQLERGS